MELLDLKHWFAIYSKRWIISRTIRVKQRNDIQLIRYDAHAKTTQQQQHESIPKTNKQKKYRWLLWWMDIRIQYVDIKCVFDEKVTCVYYYHCGIPRPSFTIIIFSRLIFFLPLWLFFFCHPKHSKSHSMKCMYVTGWVSQVHSV